MRKSIKGGNEVYAQSGEGLENLCSVIWLQGMPEAGCSKYSLFYAGSIENNI